tara:strand:- start:402 stop:581 length:180 start_codon:yes stop_codon:yes gene_type:complete
MFKFIYNLFFPTEDEKIRSQIDKKYEQSIEFQRNGNIREYSRLMKEIRDLEEQLLKSNK